MRLAVNRCILALPGVGRFCSPADHELDPFITPFHFSFKSVDYKFSNGKSAYYINRLGECLPSGVVQQVKITVKNISVDIIFQFRIL